MSEAASYGKPNTQPIEKSTHSVDVDLHSVFHTFQGEGPFAGRPAVFVRLAGCNLRCPFCDTNYTDNRRSYAPEEVVDKVKALPIQDGGLVVITGGEPFRQPVALGFLIMRLVDEGFAVQIETNGTLPTPDISQFGLGYSITFDSRGRPRPGGVYIVISPKTGKVNSATWSRACAYKYVGEAGNLDPLDGLPLTALGHTANPRLARPEHPDLPIYLQPMDAMDEEANMANSDAVIKSCLEHGYTFCAQIHKIYRMD